MKRVIALFVMGLLLVAGCSTTGHFNVPEGSHLYVHNRPDPVEISNDGTVTTTPFFWTALGIPPHSGIQYRLEQDGQVLQEGRLRTNFRPASIFWPPFALIYWPVGFNPNITYDLVNGRQ